ncbi:MAG: peptidylprolyl isomerase [Muribaculaceae bacterium]|nr:peptidylprolyl isomerase [Muribaculaceae bacterium]
MKTTLLLGAGLGICALAWAAKDPVIMTVNGVDVPKSEFEYLYHKNSQQQLAPQPLEDYVEMFVNYRLKVADAMAAGIDTTAAFRQEMDQYRHDLAAPYMTDSVYLDKLVAEAYARSLEEVPTSHIMLFKAPSADSNAASVARLDSIRNVVIAGGDFAELARQYSQDRGSSSRGGSLGYIPAGRYPYTFEVTAYELKPGEVSQVIESPVAYHIIRTGEHRPARGTVRAAHILILDQNGTPEESAARKARIDSIYSVVKATPSKFEEMAMRYSDDKGSARQGGLLQWFGSGVMVQEFDSVAFALPVGQISEPFRTQFGWHIINKIDRKDPPAIDEMRPAEIARIMNPQDERYALVKNNQTARLAKKHNARLNDPLVARLKAYAAESGVDSVFYVTFSEPAIAGTEIMKVGKTEVPLSALIASMHGGIQPNPVVGEKYLDNAISNFENATLVAAEEEWLEANEPDYRNLLHEYTNGSLLYEASVRNVWDKASKDTNGLEEYFKRNRANYKWDVPHAKGILVQAKNDSVAADIAARYAALPKDEAVATLKKEYKGEATIDRVLVQRGQNPMVDALMFGTGDAVSPNANFATCIMIDGRVIDEPEEVSDVRGLVTGDYQEELEQAWVSSLRSRYPVEINQKVLKKVK